MNDDRISEVYKGEVSTSTFQERSRQRIDWMVSQIQGERVLDLGCSQGIATILAARQGFQVVGVDVQESRIEYAKADLALEPEDVRSRGVFILGDGHHLDFEDDDFDTVILGEVLEHLEDPGSLLTEVGRVLKPGGVVVITTPFGVLHHHDHRQTFFPPSLVELVGAHFGIASAEVVDRYFRMVGVNGESTDAEVPEALHASAYESVRGIQEELAELRKRALRHEAEVEDLKAETRLATKRAEKAEKSKEKAQTAWRETKQHLKEERAARSASERQYRSVAAELRRVSEQSKLAARQAGELERVRRLAWRRDQQIARLRYRLEVSDWKLKSLRQRRWLRLGAELGALRRDPMRVLRVPARIMRVLRDRPERLPRPSPPPELEAPGEGGTGPQNNSDSLRRIDWTPPVIPRRDVATATVLSSELESTLAHELQTFALRPTEWQQQLEALRPSLLIVEPTVFGEWRWEELLGSARERGIKSVLRTGRSNRVAEDIRARFDVVWESDPTAPVPVQPRVHNPIGARRTSDVAVVDLANLMLADERFPDVTSLSLAAKRYKVLVEVGRPSRAQLAPLAATATPILSVTDDDRFAGLGVASEEEAVALEQSLLRSEVLRARMTHPRMRQVLREPGLPAQVRSMLGEDGPEWPHIDVMVATKRPENLATILDNLGRQSYPDFSLWIVTHGFKFDEPEVREAAIRAGVDLAAIVPVEESVILGEVFNIGFGETQSDIVAKMDDDDFYGAEYLWDLYSALDFSGAEVAGKWAHYVYLEGADTTIYRFKDYEHRFTDVVAISTLLMRREVLQVERFPAMPWGSGSVFLRALGAQGGQIFAGDRWNYLYRRGSDGDNNTFPISDMKLLSNSDVVCRGVNLDEVSV